MLQDFGRLRMDWDEQKQVLKNLLENVTAKLAEKNAHPECEKTVQNMWTQAQGHLGELSGRVTLLEQKKSTPELGESPQQVTNLTRDFAKLHGVVDGQADILQNVDSRLERIEGQIQQEGVPELRANFYGLNRNFETLAASYQQIKGAIAQLAGALPISAPEDRKKGANKNTTPSSRKNFCMDRHSRKYGFGPICRE